jgi:hypothetical protein
MFAAPLARTVRLTRWVHTGSRSVPRLYDSSPYNHQDPRDLDGACPACDHPYGQSNHICIGAVTHTAS